MTRAWCARPGRWAWMIPGMTCAPSMRPGPLSSSRRRCPGWTRTGPGSCATMCRTRPRPGSRCPAPSAAAWAALAAARAPGEDWTEAQADLAASVQRRLEEVLLALAGELHARTGDRLLVMAGGTALNCVANTVLAGRGPFDEVWVQPAAGDAGTALGAALQLAADAGEPPWSMTGADLGRGFTDAEIEAALRTARVPFDRPPDVASAA